MLLHTYPQLLKKARPSNSRRENTAGRRQAGRAWCNWGCADVQRERIGEQDILQARRPVLEVWQGAERQGVDTRPLLQKAAQAEKVNAHKDRKRNGPRACQVHGAVSQAAE